MPALYIMIMIHVCIFHFFCQSQTFRTASDAGCLYGSSDAERKNAYPTKICAQPQKHLAELKRKAGENKQILCSVCSFLNPGLRPCGDKLPEGKAAFSNLPFDVRFRSSILAAVFRLIQRSMSGSPPLGIKLCYSLRLGKHALASSYIYHFSRS